VTKVRKSLLILFAALIAGALPAPAIAWDEEPTAKCNSGNGNGSETEPANDCDPGNSGGHNNGGD
jgi:hypothetical protein